MNTFDFHYPVRQHFGKGCAGEAIRREMKSVGTRVLLAYGGSLKRTGLYDKIRSWLDECGKQTDFQCHMIEHAVGAYTDCNHGRALAVIHPPLYRHLLDDGTEKLVRMAEAVWACVELHRARRPRWESTPSKRSSARQDCPHAGARWE